jgi:DDE superfamily endonuclease
VHHRPKWQLVLDMVDELGTWDLVPPVLVADAGYGEVGEFRQGLDDRQIPYVVQVKADTSAYPEQTRPTVAPYTGKGRRPRPRYRDKPASLKQLALAAGLQAGVELIWRRAARACNAPASWPCGSARPGSLHGGRPPPRPTAPDGSCRPGGC